MQERQMLHQRKVLRSTTRMFHPQLLNEAGPVEHHREHKRVGCGLVSRMKKPYSIQSSTVVRSRLYRVSEPSVIMLAMLFLHGEERRSPGTRPGATGKWERLKRYLSDSSFFITRIKSSLKSPELDHVARHDVQIMSRDTPKTLGGALCGHAGRTYFALRKKARPPHLLARLGAAPEDERQMAPSAVDTVPPPCVRLDGCRRHLLGVALYQQQAPRLQRHGVCGGERVSVGKVAVVTLCGEECGTGAQGRGWQPCRRRARGAACAVPAHKRRHRMRMGGRAGCLRARVRASPRAPGTR